MNARLLCLVGICAGWLGVAPAVWGELIIVETAPGLLEVYPLSEGGWEPDGAGASAVTLVAAGDPGSGGAARELSGVGNSIPGWMVWLALALGLDGLRRRCRWLEF